MNMEKTKKCPYCGEEIKAAAKKCRFCNEWLVGNNAEATTPKEQIQLETVNPIESEIPEKENTQDNGKAPIVPESKPSSKSQAKREKNNLAYWVVGMLAIILFIGGICLVRNNKQAYHSADSIITETDSVKTENDDIEAKIKQLVETMYAEVFSSPNENSESRYLARDFYNIYVEARNSAGTGGINEMKRILWCNGKAWGEKIVYIKNVAEPVGTHVHVFLELIDSDTSENNLNDIRLHFNKADGEWKIEDISYDGYSVKERLQGLISSNKQEDRSESNITQDSYDASNDEYDHWLGSMVVDGCVYRLCDTLVRLTFEKNGEGIYKGNIWMGLGSYLSDNSGRFDYWDGQLEGKIRAKATSRNSLLVTMVSCSAKSGVHESLLKPIPFKSGDQILLITKKGAKYEAKPIGKMENFLDGCEISVIK